MFENNLLLKSTVVTTSLLLLSACQTEESSGAEKAENFDETTESTTNYEFDYKKISDGVTDFGVVENPNNGPDISFSLSSEINILTEEIDGEDYYFKDLNDNNNLDEFEDWRLDAETRAEALAKELSTDQIAGLMLFSSHESNQADGLTDDQKNYLENDNLRNVLHAGPSDVEDTVTWTNQMQAFVENLGSEEEPMIPVNFSSDPRSTAGETAYDAEGEISRWPSNLGMAATFNPDIMRDFSKMSSEEYRALGITMALGPQIDLATEPRWTRVDGTFGEDSKLAVNMAEAYTNESQSTFDEDGNDLGWGENSIAIMNKHFPGDGPGEGGREAHTFEGKFGIYPGDNFEEHLSIFTEGGMNLSGETEKTASIMTSYSIQVDSEGDVLLGDSPVASAYNPEVLNVLREDNNYEGIVVTDWGVTGENNNEYGEMGASFGYEGTSNEERHFAVIKAGVDMFGGNNDKLPVLAAYNMWEEAYENGELEQSANERFQESAQRIITPLFNVGIFEDPYLDLEESEEIVASNDKVEAGYQAQLDSVVMLKNKNETIKPSEDVTEYEDQTVYIPSTMHTGFEEGAMGPTEPSHGPGMDIEVAEQYFGEVITDTEIINEDGELTGFEQPNNLDNVDLVIIGMESPDNGGNFDHAGLDNDGETYYPISLQYRPYTADGDNVRRESIGGDILEDGTKENRSYYGNTSQIANEYDLDSVLNAVELAEQSEDDIPLVVAMKAKNPVIMSEFENEVDAIVTGFGVSDNALFDIILGKQEPQGLLPVQFPEDMDTVEAQLEDVGRDMNPYIDSEGNSYDFGYGLNYNGIIDDARTEKYK